MDELIISVFYEVDNLCISLNSYLEAHSITSDGKNSSLELPCALTLSEAMTVCILFHLTGFRTFKQFYTDMVSRHWRKFFPKLVSYGRFVEIMPYLAVPLTFFVCAHSGDCTGISFVDSTTLDVCDSHRIEQHKVFRDIARRGKSSTGWFYGFKHHLAVNDRGEIMGFCLTAGNTDDRDPKVMGHLTKKMFGKLFADKGYISHKLFEALWKNGAELVTKTKKNTKKKALMQLSDKILLRKRAVIESVNDFLKNICQIEHSRHRSVRNFLTKHVYMFMFLQLLTLNDTSY